MTAEHTVESYHGNYDSFLIEREGRYQKALAAYNIQQKEKQRLEEWLARNRARATARPNPALWSLIRAKQKYLEREIINKPVQVAARDQYYNLSQSGGTHRGKRVFRMQWFDLCVPGKMLAQNIHIDIYGKDRVLLRGENGSGKSTLLAAFMSAVSGSVASSDTLIFGPELRVGYFDQKNESLDLSKTVWAEFEFQTRWQNMDHYQRFNYLRRFGFDQHSLDKKIETLSYGQRVRFRFALMNAFSYDVLILDEPTNHLDIQTREMLEAMLQEYKGAMILVSHDQYFLQQIDINRVLLLENMQLSELWEDI